MKRILTITLNPAVDETSSVGSLQPEKKLRCSAPVFEPGGGGINVARVINRLGGRALPLYFSGGNSGKRLTALLAEEDITGLPVEIHGETRENLNITDRSTGRQYRFIMPGPTVSSAEYLSLMQAAQAEMDNTEYLVFSGSLPPNGSQGIFKTLAETAMQKKVRLLADTSGEGLREALEAGIYLVKPNLGELAALTGCETLLEADAVSAARGLIRQGSCQVFVISMGEAGALLVTADISEKIPAPIVKRVSTIGAGDSMVAGIVLALQRGQDIHAAARFGIACGTAATLNPGTALCNKEDAERLYGLMNTGSKCR
ncbi:1-phosphofructokinase family hexose kinase [Chitinophaga cymbidii]|uniref:Phosphofructokinase n=1 Tax=Chitinophaga cymbidii TaxID=1096750 RepID=A0A512RMS0_9BACT|nr:1-phosphofructokinase family hexose kinase [Chitinophaga cymbidii]GEP96988.1 phosphofructokinase [Chitinophaga cymbidii]